MAAAPNRFTQVGSDVVIEILSFLFLRERYYVSLTCRTLRKLCRTPSAYRTLAIHGDHYYGPTVFLDMIDGFALYDYDDAELSVSKLNRVQTVHMENMGFWDRFEDRKCHEFHASLVLAAAPNVKTIRFVQKVPHGRVELKPACRPEHLDVSSRFLWDTLNDRHAHTFSSVKSIRLRSIDGSECFTKDIYTWGILTDREIFPVLEEIYWDTPFVDRQVKVIVGLDAWYKDMRDLSDAFYIRSEAKDRFEYFPEANAIGATQTLSLKDCLPDAAAPKTPST